GGYFQQRNYEQSFIAAERALKRNPRDVVAQTLYMLSRDRRGALMTEDPGSVERRTEPPSPERSSESDKPIKPPMRMGRLQEVPALPIDDQPGQERMNWRERLEASLDSKAEAELAKADKAGKLSDKQRALALQYGKQGAKIGGVAGGGGLAAGGAWLCKGGGPKVMLGCAGAAGFFGMTLGSGLGAFIGVEVGIFQGADEKFTELWK
ncbi:MAG TPA: hypothetical protein VNT25_06850, partial [Allosphingosinicella sp.]|nr:hypothetical protein [Allosphingosinicella sp.]